MASVTLPWSRTAIGSTLPVWRFQSCLPALLRRPYSTEQLEPTKAEKKAQWKRNAKSTQFLDTLTISIKAGSGGDGCVSFARAKYIEYGPPSGGSGGAGGSVYIRVIPGLRSLARLPSRVIAGDGGMGKGDWQGGKKGREVVISVPVGTVLKTKVLSLDELGEGADPGLALRKEYEEGLMSRLRRDRLKKLPSLSDTAAEEGHAQEGDEIDQQEPSTNYAAEEEAAQERRELINSVWRYYPGPGGAVEGVGADESDQDDLFSREDFRLAEERYAINLRNARNQQRQQQRETSAQSDPRSQPSEPEEDGSNIITVDLSTPTPADDSVGMLIARGGTGGHGNPFFLSGASRSPKFATRGRAGEVVEAVLEFKSPADVGFVGLPNAGKSSLLRALTGATKSSAKVGGWAFTTLSPNVGMLRLDAINGNLVGTGSEPIYDSSEADSDLPSHLPKADAVAAAAKENRLMIADLPGLIKGASLNIGLGHEFLRHAERCTALVYVVDVSPSRPEPWQDIAVLKDELEQYRTGLSNKVVCVIANKCDTLGPKSKSSEDADEDDTERGTVEEARAKLAKLKEAVNPLPVFPISAKWRMGVEATANSLWQLTQAQEAQNGEDDAL